jgi:hypothetical protein
VSAPTFNIDVQIGTYSLKLMPTNSRKTLTRCKHKRTFLGNKTKITPQSEHQRIKHDDIKHGIELQSNTLPIKLAITEKISL